MTSARTHLAGLTLAALLAATPAFADFSSCVAGLRSQALSQGISGETFDAAFKGVTAEPKVIELMNNQPEFKTPIWDYLAALTDDEKVADGKAAMRQYASARSAAEQRYGVDKYAIAAVWGVESDFGKAGKKFYLPQALSSLVCLADRRQAYFRGELLSTLNIIQRADR